MNGVRDIIFMCVLPCACGAAWAGGPAPAAGPVPAEAEATITLIGDPAADRPAAVTGRLRLPAVGRKALLRKAGAAGRVGDPSLRRDARLGRARTALVEAELRERGRESVVAMVEAAREGRENVSRGAARSDALPGRGAGR